MGRRRGSGGGKGTQRFLKRPDIREISAIKETWNSSLGGVGGTGGWEGTQPSLKRPEFHEISAIKET